MRRFATWRTAAAAVILVVAMLPREASMAEQIFPVPPAPGPVVVELFTSQGCSSCPPADALLSELAAADPTAQRLIPLSFHVDYWNHIGWRDPFSTAAWSDRQRAYSQAFREDTIYTPQMVFNGRSHCVGSRRDCVEQELAEALAKRPLAEVEVAVDAGSQGSWVATVDARWLEGSKPRPLALVAVIFETGLSTAVKRGENARRTLDNDFVVRWLQQIDTLPPRQEASAHQTVTLELESGWRRDRLGVVVFLQDEQTREIVAAARWAGL